MKIAILTGAGISVESGIETFRDIKNGLWYNYDVEKVATHEGWVKDPATVLEFHNMLRAKAKDIKPNAAHLALAELENGHDVTIVTQNVDDLHEKAGSSLIYHIHGEILKGRDSKDNLLDIKGDLNIGDLDQHGKQIRPHTVLFGEMPFYFYNSLEAIVEADILIIVGTSISISYIPDLIASVNENCKVFYVDPDADASINLMGLSNLEIIRKKASVGVPALVNRILSGKIN